MYVYLFFPENQGCIFLFGYVRLFFFSQKYKCTIIRVCTINSFLPKVQVYNFGMYSYSFCPNFPPSHNGIVRSQDLFWWKWLTGQAMAALNYKLNLRVMEQSGADQNCMGGIPPCLGAHNTIQICRKMHLDLTIPKQFD